MDDAVSPLPMPEMTPPETRTNFVSTPPLLDPETPPPPPSAAIFGKRRGARAAGRVTDFLGWRVLPSVELCAGKAGARARWRWFRAADG